MQRKDAETGKILGIRCPHDMDWDGIYIVDDELDAFFGRLPTGINLEILLDCCHSGTGTREARGIETLPRELSFKPRFLTPPADIQARVDDEAPPLSFQLSSLIPSASLIPVFSSR